MHLKPLEAEGRGPDTQQTCGAEALGEWMSPPGPGQDRVTAQSMQQCGG